MSKIISTDDNKQLFTCGLDTRITIGALKILDDFTATATLPHGLLSTSVFLNIIIISNGRTSISSKAAFLASAEAWIRCPTSSRFTHFKQRVPGRLEFLNVLPQSSQSMAITRRTSSQKD